MASSRVDFGYAFGAPHRLTVARPDSSDKTLLDLEAGRLRMAWTYQDLRSLPLAAFVTPPTTWDVHVQPTLDDQPFACSEWTRAGGFLPVLDNAYCEARGCVHLQVAGGASATVVSVRVVNTGDVPHRLALQCEVPGKLAGYNPAWVDATEPSDCLLAGWRDRADRVVLLGLGADVYPVDSNTLSLVWELQPGEERTGWVVRPYRAVAADLPTLRAHDWAAELEQAKAEWRALLERASCVSIPDSGVRDGFYACLADLFVMREPVAGGAIAGTPGTEGYRAPNAFEPAIMAVALDQLGLHEEAAAGYQMCLEQQGADGNWADPEGWGHLMWAGSGFKAWAAMEHFRLTGDRAYLAAVYPRMRASSRWQELQRRRTRTSSGGEKPLTYGLMPRGMGDCGLLDDGDYYGVFLPHNVWAVYADRLCLEAAEILGMDADLPELRRIYEVALADLLEALDRGAIVADGYRWIPGVPGKTCGSRWGVLNAVFPTGILSPDHELISGTLQRIEAALSPGGLPLNTGWMPDGMWVAISLDNLAETHLVRGNGDAAAEYLYAVLNHGTPLYTWCEERGQEAGTTVTSGDRQHLWTPVAVVRAIRDSMLMEQGQGLHLARGAARGWLASGEPIGIADAPTHFGRVSYTAQADLVAKTLSGQVSFPAASSLAWAVLHVRLPSGWRVAHVDPSGGAELLAGGAGLRWERPRGAVSIAAELQYQPE